MTIIYETIVHSHRKKERRHMEAPMEVWKCVRKGRMGWPFSATVVTNVDVALRLLVALVSVSLVHDILEIVDKCCCICECRRVGKNLHVGEGSCYTLTLQRCSTNKCGYRFPCFGFKSFQGNLANCTVNRALHSGRRDKPASSLARSFTWVRTNWVIMWPTLFFSN